MKNKFLLLAVLFVLYFIPQQSKAQLYEQGDIKINAGISFGIFGFGSYGLYNNYSGFLPLTANVEYSITDKFAVGGYAGYYSRSYTYGSGRYKDGFRSLAIGGRGTFHGTSTINEIIDANIDEDKIDLYASLIVGLETRSWFYDNDYWNQPGFVEPNYSEVRLRFGPTLGVRYMFTPNIGAYFEGGRGAFGFATIGVTFKL